MLSKSRFIESIKEEISFTAMKITAILFPQKSINVLDGMSIFPKKDSLFVAIGSALYGIKAIDEENVPTKVISSILYNLAHDVYLESVRIESQSLLGIDQKAEIMESNNAKKIFDVLRCKSKHISVSKNVDDIKNHLDNNTMIYKGQNQEKDSCAVIVPSLENNNNYNVLIFSKYYECIVIGTVDNAVYTVIEYFIKAYKDAENNQQSLNNGLKKLSTLITQKNNLSFVKDQEIFFNCEIKIKDETKDAIDESINKDKIEHSIFIDVLSLMNKIKLVIKMIIHF